MLDSGLGARYSREEGDVPDTTLEETEDHGGQCEADETEGTWVGDFEEGWIVDLRDG